MAQLRLTRVAQALQQATRYLQQRWQSLLGGKVSLPPPTPVTETADGLRTSLTLETLETSSSEEGHGAYHFPSRIDWARSPKARRTKGGRYYLIIPFRHYSAQRGARAQAGSPASRRQMLTRAVYDVARLLRPGQYLTAGPSRGQAVHAPGLTPYVPQLPQNVRPGYTHAAVQERLRRVPGGRTGRGAYLTFRTMTQDSPGWWIPARSARPHAQTAESAGLAREVAPGVRRLVEVAAVADVAAHIRDALRGWPGAH